MMRQERRRLLDANLLAFSQDLDLSEVVLHLQAAGLFTDVVVNKITSCSSPGESRRALLRAVKSRGDAAFDAFFYSLVRSRQDHLAALLRPLVNDTVLQSIENEPRSSASASSSSSSSSLCESKSLFDESPMDLAGVLENLSVEGIDGNSVQEQLNMYERNKTTVYPNFSSPKGLCLIINNEHFSCMSRRQGTEVDRTNLQNLFTQLGYKVILEDDLTAKEMTSRLSDFARDPFHRRSSSVVIVVLTHGEHEVLLGVDDQPVYVQNFLSCLNSVNSPHLAGKPKLIFLQACRGEKYDHGIATTEVDGGSRIDGFNPFSCIIPQTERPVELSRLPVESDFLIAYATPPRYVSWRNSVNGSWFVQAVCEVFARHAQNCDLVEMLTLVNQRVSQSKTTRSEKQIPDFSCRLRKKFYFFPGVERSSAV